jgi:hypothetical protein
MEIKVKGKIEFKDSYNKEYDREFTATLGESRAFQYGNGTYVEIEWGKMANGGSLQNTLLDTRYDITIKNNEKDFKKWVENYFKENYDDHILTIY